MGVYIKNMETPKNCKKCMFADFDDVEFDYELYCAISKKYADLDACDHPLGWTCPLTEVKEPHGRLGDLDELWDRIYNYIDNEGAKMPFGDNDFMIHKDSACELIEDAPTVIEAEEK